jgi:hypothetical protein
VNVAWALASSHPSYVDRALQMLRDPTTFNWTTIPLLGFAIYVYAVEIERQNWSLVLAGLAFWLMDWVNEIVNSLVLHFTNYAPIWTATGHTSFEIFVGLNIEISLLFFIAGITFCKQLPRDPKARILGIPNRWIMVLGFSCFSVFVEVLLNRTGYFSWAYWWWNFPNLLLIVIFGYATFYGIAAWVFDMPRLADKVRVVAVMSVIVGLALVGFGPVLGWI